jgi:sirohydrochlorin ferrochelatase
MSILEALTTRQAMTSPRDAYLLPVVLAELDAAEANAELSNQVEARRPRMNADAEKYLAFAAAFACVAGSTTDY